MLLTAAYVIISLHQWRAMDNQLSEMRTQSRDAKESAAFAEAATKLTERADVLLEEVTLAADSRGHTNTPQSRVILKFKNFGRTRANKTTFSMSLVVEGRTPISPEQSGPIILGAGESHYVYFPYFVACMPNEISQVFNGARAMRIAGKISYVDIFGEAHTEYCSGVYDSPSRNFPIIENHAY
jgi:hypothetical protein